MAVVSYYTVCGLILGESNGSSRSNYLYDSIGSVTSVETNGTATAAGPYTPYGRSSSSLAFGWLGCLGYRATSNSAASHYVRKRHYSNYLGRWTSKDPLGWNRPRSVASVASLYKRLSENAYKYVQARPTAFVDPSGLDFEVGPGVSVLGFEDCVEYPFSFPFLEGKASVIIELCEECFKCCKPGDWATHCDIISLKFQQEYSLSVLITGFFEFLEHLGEDVVDAINFLGNLFSLMGKCVGAPANECEEKGVSFKWQLCVELCLFVTDFEGCVGTSGVCEDQHFKLCIDPTASISLSFEIKDCQ